MERLQSAIAKARATRQGHQDRQQDTVGQKSGKTDIAQTSTVSANSGELATASEWAQLPEIRVSEKVLGRHRIVSAIGRGSEAVEFDRLRTRILQKMQANGWKSVAITSPGPGCGKSTISLNLAYGLARQDFARVMLLELDMRRPSLGDILGVKLQSDFSRVLAGEQQIEKNLARLQDNLAIGTSLTTPDSAELLQSSMTRTVLADIEARYQPSILICDMPPFRVSDDVISFIGKVDCVLIVAAAGQTSIDELDECERELAAQTPVLGVVLNKCRYQDKGDDYYYDS